MDNIIKHNGRTDEEQLLINEVALTSLSNPASFEMVCEEMDINDEVALGLLAALNAEMGATSR